MRPFKKVSLIDGLSFSTSYNFAADSLRLQPVGVNFRTQVARRWLRSLRRRSQRHRLDWQRMGRLVARWLPPARITHPWPEQRFGVRTRGKSPVR